MLSQKREGRLGVQMALTEDEMEGLSDRWAEALEAMREEVAMSDTNPLADVGFGVLTLDVSDDKVAAALARGSRRAR